ncbi:hypothetical protein ACJMK2_035058 [Sinanodonta woodiana]|uniref:Uncharacterized protein n=1 Tax=Sinanodonta woodiana TaxID=1069815 RepID=A0ABD3WX16_SINWO
MSDLKIFSGIGNSYKVMSDKHFWFYEMQVRSQIEREFADKAERWLKNVSDKLYIMGRQNVDGINQIESALQMELSKTDERIRAAIVYSRAYEEAASSLLSESETADEKAIFSKYETSFKEMMKPYENFLDRVEEGRKVYQKSMIRLEKLVMEESEFWFKTMKLHKARDTAKINSDKYIKLLQANTNQVTNIDSLSKEYERVAMEIADKKVKSFVKCWSNCMSCFAENFTGETRNIFKQGEKLLSKVDSEMLIKQLSELNKQTYCIPKYQEYQGTLDVVKLLGYRPVVEKDDHADSKNEMNAANSFTLFEPFSSKEAVYGDEKKEEENNSLTHEHSSGARKLSQSVKAVVITKYTKMECLEMSVKPGTKVEVLTPPNSMGMVHVRILSRIAGRQKCGFIPSSCILLDLKEANIQN